MNRKPEVLAPAGSPESLTAAVRAGADAVYLGTPRFSARAGAQNFGPDELRQAVEYCHARGIKVHLALNTLLTDSELSEVLRLAEFACSLPVDAVLVQDMGLARELLRRAPGMVLHASTQTGVHTAAGAQTLLAAGFRRLVLARELSLRETAEISRQCPIELEAFVHGALCMSVSGQCYFSVSLGSRSGNRGMCAQPCRLPFSAPGGTGHDLSLHDLSLIDRTKEMTDSGICSLKIEGRLKRPEYVAAATRACRCAADGEPVPPELESELRAVFSRSGFTQGYADGKTGRAMFGIRSREDAAEATSGVLASLRGIFASEIPKIPVDFTLKIPYNKPTILTAEDGNGNREEINGTVPETAVSRPVTAERCEEQLRRTGGTPFFVRSIHCDVAPGLAVPAAELNRLRREALSSLEKHRAERPSVSFDAGAMPSVPEHRAVLMKLRARFFTPELPEAAKGCELVYVPVTVGAERLSSLLEQGYPAAAELPRGLFGLEERFRRLLHEAYTAGIRDAWAGNLDSVRLALDAGLRVHGGFSLNITNTQALEWYRELGLADAELSPELKLSQAAHIGGAAARGLVIYGRLPLMLCRNCPAANSPRGCMHCKTAPELTDRRGIRFPVQCFGACSEVLNSVPLYLADKPGDLKNLDFGLLRFSTETPQEAENILRAYFAAPGRAPKPAPGSYTRGLSYRGFEPQQKKSGTERDP